MQVFNTHKWKDVICVRSGQVVLIRERERERYGYHILLNELYKRQRAIILCNEE